MCCHLHILLAPSPMLSSSFSWQLGPFIQFFLLFWYVKNEASPDWQLSKETMLHLNNRADLFILTLRIPWAMPYSSSWGGSAHLTSTISLLMFRPPNFSAPAEGCFSLVVPLFQAAGFVLLHDIVYACQMILTAGCNGPGYYHPHKLHFGSCVSAALCCVCSGSCSLIKLSSSSFLLLCQFLLAHW